VRFTLVRQIHFHSPNAGSVTKSVSKEIESEITPQVGFVFEDSAWHRNDETKAESISIESSTGACTVYLNSKEVADAASVETIFNTSVQHHEWKDWLAR
jgi:hypothetical protein